MPLSDRAIGDSSRRAFIEHKRLKIAAKLIFREVAGVEFGNGQLSGIQQRSSVRMPGLVKIPDNIGEPLLQISEFILMRDEVGDRSANRLFEIGRHEKNRFCPGDSEDFQYRGLLGGREKRFAPS